MRFDLRALAAAAVLAFLTTPAPGADIGYGFVDLGYSYAEIGDPQLGLPEGDGFGVRLSYPIADWMHVGLELRRLNLDARFRSTDFSISQVQGRLVGGVDLSLAKRLDGFAQISAENFQSDSAFAGVSVNEWGYGVAGGLRWRIGPVELNGLARYIDYTGFADDISLQAAGLYRFGELFSIGVQGETDEDFNDTIVLLFLRYAG